MGARQGSRLTAECVMGRGIGASATDRTEALGSRPAAGSLQPAAYRVCPARRLRVPVEAVLERLDGHAFFAEGFHGADGGFGGLRSGDARDAVGDAGGADAAFVSAGAFAAGRID